MSTAILERVPVDQITEQARQAQFARTVLTVLAALFYAIGWVAGSLWFAASYAGFSIKAGWIEGRRSSGGRRAGAGTS